MDSYLSMRVIPSVLIHYIFALFHIAFSNPNIVTAFEILNIFCLVTGAYFVKKIFIHLKISLKNQLLGFVLLFLNFACGKFIYYYPVLTDASGFLLGILILYFYLKDHVYIIAFITLLAAFTWPPVFLQGIIFLLFPVFKNAPQPIDKTNKYIISSASVLYFAILILFFVIIKKEDTGMLFTLRIDKGLLPISIGFLLFFAAYLPLSICNKNFFSMNFIRQHFRLKNLILVFIIVILFVWIKQLFSVRQSEFLSIEHFLKSPLLSGLTKPLIYLVAHATFYGVAIILMLFFWKEICSVISEFGIGLTLAFLLNIYLTNFVVESRGIINIFPWLIIFLVVVFEKYKIRNEVYFILTAINFLASKIWLTIGYSAHSGIDENGALGFPNQKLFMNIGPWMSHEMWKTQGTVLLLYILLIFALKKFSFI